MEGELKDLASLLEGMGFRVVAARERFRTLDRLDVAEVWVVRAYSKGEPRAKITVSSSGGGGEFRVHIYLRGVGEGDVEDVVESYGGSIDYIGEDALLVFKSIDIKKLGELIEKMF
ncbi:MAG: hypothetical protein F7B20_02315 [Aeropyrum sp.]|nr:hypothetical protein [Aeropyrum sp.]MCE4615807.1 hypothetical protein [Aeropyrum sp.]